MDKTKKRRIQILAASVFWLGVWQAAAAAIGQEVFLVSPVQAIGTLVELLPQAEFWQRIGFSAGRILLGFGLGVLSSAVLAVAAEKWEWVDALLAPVMQLVKATPVASFIILALVWVSGSSLSVLISFLMVLPVLYSAVRTGIGSADRQLLEMAQVFRLPLGRRLRAVWLPAVLPAFRQGCSVALGICWKSGVAAEVIGLPDGSIGDALYRAKITLSTGELFAWTFVIILLSVLNISYADYKVSAAPVNYLLLPATISLAIPLYEKWDLLKENAAAIIAGISVGTLVSLGSALALALALGLTREQYATLLPKSVTTAISMDVAAELGGIAALTGAIVILTGIAGNLLAEVVCKIFHITDPIAKGVGIGTSAHAVGTSKALQMGEVEGAMSGLSIAVAGVLTAVLCPLFVGFIQ